MTHFCHSCSLAAEEHEIRCYLGEPDVIRGTSTRTDGTTYEWAEHSPHHEHELPLCCLSCPCLSVEWAHPEVVGHTLESLADILGRKTLSTRTINLLKNHQYFTAERMLSTELVFLCNIRGVGTKTYIEILTTRRLWRKAVDRGDVTPKPLPEDSEQEEVDA